MVQGCDTNMNKYKTRFRETERKTKNNNKKQLSTKIE